MIRLILAFLLASFVVTPVGAQARQAPLAPQSPAPGYVVVDDMILPMDVVYGDSAFNATLWPAGIVPYVFDGSLSGGNITELQVAMAEIAAVSAVLWIPRTTQANFVRFVASTVNLSSVGMVGGQQILNIVSWGSRYIIIHEMFHALGFIHEQSRSDRDTFVTINGGNIQAGQAGNFNQVNTSQNVTAYDFLSIMHYDQCAFSTQCPPGSTCGCAAHTIDCKPAFAGFQNQMGNRSYLSLGDAQGLQAYYGTAFLLPSITSMTPTAATTASGNVTIDVFGSQFFPGSPNASGVQGTKVTWNGSILPTTFIDTNHVRATVAASFLTQTGTALIRVQNPSPGAGTSLGSLTFTITCPPSLMTLGNSSPQTLTNTCTNFSFAPAGNTFNVVAVSSPSDWDITIGGVSAAAGGGTCDVVAGSGFQGVGTVTPTSGSIFRYSGTQSGTAEYVTTSSISSGIPVLGGIPSGSIVRAHHIYPGAVGVYNISTAGDPSLRWYLIWKGNSPNFQWVSSTGSALVSSGYIGGSMVTGVTLLPGPYVFAVCRNGGPQPTYSDYTLNVCFSASNTVIGPSASSTPLVGANQGFCFPFSFTQQAGRWNVVGVTSSSDWDVSAGAAVSQLGGNNCDYVIANGHLGSVSPTSGTAARYSGTANGELCLASITTLSGIPGWSWPATYSLTVNEFNVPVAGNYDLTVSTGVAANWSWDLHRPGANAGWRRKIDRMAGGYPSDNVTRTFALTAGWHAIVLNRSGGDAPILANHAISVAVSAFQPPTLSALSPASIPANSGTFALTANGTDFDATSEIRWNGAALPTTFVSATELQASVDGTLILLPGTANVTVFTPGPFGGSSGALPFTIDNGVPTITAVTPGTFAAGSPTTAFTVDGSGFAPNSEVQWDGVGIPTTYVSDTQLVAHADALLLAIPTSANVVVFNPAPGGGLGAGAGVVIAAPAISWLTPASIALQLPAALPFTITLTGGWFVPGSVVYLDGVALATTYFDPSQLEITLDPALFPKTAFDGGICVNVLNGPGAVSNSQPLPIGASANLGTIRLEPLAPLPSEAFSILLENGLGYTPFLLVVDTGLPVATPLFPDPASNLCLQVTDLAGSAGPWIPLLDGLGIFGPPDGSAFDAYGTFALPGLTMPAVPLGLTVYLQALYPDASIMPAGFNLTWTRAVNL